MLLMWRRPIIASRCWATAPRSPQLDVDGTTIPAGTFQDLTLTYTSPATGTAIGRNMAILIRFTNNRSVFAEGEADNVA